MSDVDPPTERGASPSRGWPTRLFSAFTLLALVGLAAMAYWGYETGRDIRGGTIRETVTDPAAPGYRGVVNPTPVYLIAVPFPDGSEIADFFVMVPSTDDDGGSLVWIPGDLVIGVPESEEGTSTLAAMTSPFDLSGARVSIHEMLGLGVTDEAILLPEEAEAIFGAGEPVEVDNPDTVFVGGDPSIVTVEGQSSDELERRFDEGELELTPEETLDFMTVRGVGETAVSRGIRTEEVVDDLANYVAEGGTIDGVSVATDVGADLVGALTQVLLGDLRYESLPVVELEFMESRIYQPDTLAIQSLMNELVRFPVSGAPGQRARVEVFNGVEGLNQDVAVAPTLTGFGTEIHLVGNADTFDHETTVVRYHGPEWEDTALLIQRSLGVGTVEEVEADGTSDITVILGRDMAP